MASHVYRFRSNGPSAGSLGREVPGTPAVVADSGFLFVDVNLDDAYLGDLTDSMSERGWSLVDTDPVGAVATAAFTSIAAALAAATAAVSFNGQQITNVADPTSPQGVATKAYVDAAASAVTAGAGLTKTGNTIDVGANADGSIVVNANDIQVGVLATDAQHGQRGGGTQHTEASTTEAGFMSAADKTKLDNLPLIPKTDTLVWGSWALGTTVTPKFLAPGYNDSPATLNPHSFRVPTDGSIKGMRVHHNVLGTGTANITYTLRRNGNPEALSCTLAPTAADASDLTNIVEVSVGELIDVRVTKASSITASPNDIMVTVEYAPL